MKRNEKGITLVVFIIVLVVLLILTTAGVGALFLIQENKNIANTEIENVNTIYENSAQEEETEEIEGNINENINSNTLVAMFKKAKGANCDGTNCDDTTHLHIGDYLDYKPIDGSVSVGKEETGYDGMQSYTVDKNTTWRVLGLNEQGTQVVIISGSPIKKDGDDIYLIMQGAESYINGSATLDKICEIYKNDLAQEARSIRVKDIKKATEGKRNRLFKK